MPFDPKLGSLLNRALSNNILSGREGGRILAHVKKDGVSQAEVDQVVAALKEAVGADGVSGLDLTTSSRQKNLSKLLASLAVHHALPLDTEAAKRPDGSIDWIAALKMNDTLPEDGDTPAPGIKLPVATFVGKELSIDSAGQLAIAGEAVAIDLANTPNDAQIEALMALLRPGQLDGLDTERRTALADNLLAHLDAGLPLASNEAPGKYRTVGATMAALGALDRMAKDLPAGQVDALLDLFADAPNAMTQSLIHRALGHASLDDGQKAKFDALKVPEEMDVLLGAYDGLLAGTTTIGWNKPDAETTQLALQALSFAKSKASIDNIFEGMKIYKDLNSGFSSGSPWDAEERGHMASILEGYVDKYPQTAFVFGTFSTDAPKNLAKLSNARIADGVTAALSTPSPKIAGVPLTEAQAKTIKSLVPGLRDEKAVKAIGEALTEAAAMLSKETSFLGTDAPTKPLSPSAFKLFERLALRAFEGRESTKDGMIDTRGLLRAVKDEVGGIQKVLRPRLQSMAATPATFDGIELSAPAAKLLHGLFDDNLKSAMSVSNLAGAVKIIGDANGGKIDGAGFAQLNKLITDYKASWPDAQVLEFNKLGRMASFVVQGKEVPLCTLNGATISLASFYTEVGKSVAASIKVGANDYPWTAERWGFRAKESVELLDVIAQMTAEGSGPIVELTKQFPGKAITIIATGLAGAHEQFIYSVEGKGKFNQASDGGLVEYTGGGKPVLFEATVRDDGAFDVKTPEPGATKTTTWPVQTTYAVGDTIDMRYLDPDATKNWTEGEKFSDAHKVLKATIESFDAKGNYVVAYNKPDGTAVKKTVSLKDIILNNNPHNFALSGSTFSDVRIDIKQAPLATFLKNAQPIIDEHLPNDGSMLAMSPTELAKAQKKCVAALMAYTRDVMKYPAAKDAHPDDASKKYHEIIDGLGYWDKAPLGDLIKIGKGVCRHQCILEQLLMQQAGIDSRLASGAANTGTGNYRGLHIWTELSTADDARYLSDQTWNDAAIALWDGAYDVDKRRVEMYDRTARYDGQIVS